MHDFLRKCKPIIDLYGNYSKSSRLCCQRIKENELEVLKSVNSGDNNISFLDENNQKLRRILTDEVEFLESNGQRAKVLSAYELFRSMHQRRKVSDLVGLLQQNTD